MKLAEALMERKDVIKAIKKLEEEILNNLIHLDEDKAGAEGKVIQYQLDTEYSNLTEELAGLNLKIEHANKPIIHKIKLMQVIDREISFYNQIRKKILNKFTESFLYREVKELYGAITIETINEFIKEKEQERRALDKQIQEFNWITEVD